MKSDFFKLQLKSLINKKSASTIAEALLSYYK